MMKKNFKLLLLSVLALGLSGCGGSGDGDDGGSESNPFAKYRPNAAKDVWVKKLIIQDTSYSMVREYSEFDEEYGALKDDITSQSEHTIMETTTINKSKIVVDVKAYSNEELIEGGLITIKGKNGKTYESSIESFDPAGNPTSTTTRKEYKWEGSICKGYTDYMEGIDGESQKNIISRKVKDMKVLESQSTYSINGGETKSRPVVKYSYDDGLILRPNYYSNKLIMLSEGNPFLPSRVGNVSYTVTFYDNGLVKTWKGSNGHSETYEYINKEDAKNE